MNPSASCRLPRGPSPAVLLASAAAGLITALALASCASAPRSLPPERVSPPPVPERIMGAGFAGADLMAAFLLANNPSLEPSRARDMADLYREEASLEGVNADVAFAQMCVETGFLKFGGLVTEDMNNFCGLGSIGPGQRGLSFPDPRTGVRAHVQHLKAYGSAEPLAQPSVDPRYRYVQPKGKAPLVAGLSGTWAADPEYGKKIAGMLARLYAAP